MAETTRKRASLLAPLVLGAACAGIVLGLGCAGTYYGTVAYDYFAAPDPDDPWSLKIEYWQARERGEGREGPGSVTAPVAGSGRGDAAIAGVGDLEAKYASYRNESRRAMARDLADWIQRQAKDHYLPDGTVDHWATLGETFRSNGDDCDGLELLAYNFLRDLGFGDDEVYRAIVYRRSDGQHHMVTFWFEDPEDPWVIDPTGAMTSGMPRMSELPGWTPLKVFSEDEDFTVRAEVVARHGREP
jgi:hypothetical protein